MHPVLFKLGPVTIYTYGFMMATAFLTGYLVLKWEIKRIGGNPDFASSIVFWAAVGGIIGSKIFYLIENIPFVVKDPVGMIFSGAGLVFHGGIIGGTIVVVCLIIKSKLPLGVYADFIGPVLLLGQGIGRIGCFFAGCCHGCASSLPWAVVFPNAAPPANYPVHPTQLYETILNFTFFFILIKVIRPRMKMNGSTFAIYLVFAGVERFFLEFIRVNPKVALGLTNYQFSSVALVLAGIILLLFFVKRPKVVK